MRMNDEEKILEERNAFGLLVARMSLKIAEVDEIHTDERRDYYKVLDVLKVSSSEANRLRGELTRAQDNLERERAAMNITVDLLHRTEAERDQARAERDQANATLEKSDLDHQAAIERRDERWMDMMHEAVKAADNAHAMLHAERDMLREALDSEFRAQNNLRKQFAARDV